MDRELLGFVPGGTRVTFSARPNLAPVYHLYRSRTIAGLGYTSISGTLTTGADSLRWREDDVEKSDIRATIVTQDGATIHMTYTVITDLGAGGYRRLVANKKPDRVGTADYVEIHKLALPGPEHLVQLRAVRQIQLIFVEPILQH